MRPFTSKEIVVVTAILFLILSASLVNFRIALRRARDAQRKSDIGAISDALNRYEEDFGEFPLSQGGKIVACQSSKPPTLSPCEWGKDALRDISDPNYPSYLALIPQDPDRSKGASYIYFSSGRRYQIYASLEGKDEDEYSAKVEARGIACGIRICNFGKASGRTPLDKSIEEYENELSPK